MTFSLCVVTTSINMPQQEQHRLHLQVTVGTHTRLSTANYRHVYRYTFIEMYVRTKNTLSIVDHNVFTHVSFLQPCLSKAGDKSTSLCVSVSDNQNWRLYFSDSYSQHVWLVIYFMWKTCEWTWYIFLFFCILSILYQMCVFECHSEELSLVQYHPLQLSYLALSSARTILRHRAQLITFAPSLCLSIVPSLSFICVHSWWRITGANTHFTPTQSDLSWNELNRTEENTRCLSLLLAIWTYLM